MSEFSFLHWLLFAILVSPIVLGVLLLGLQKRRRPLRHLPRQRPHPRQRSQQQNPQPKLPPQSQK